jgi:UDP-glucose 4-epimerase
MPKSLVTGAAGFIGSHVCDELLKMGHQVIALDDLSGGFSENVPKRAKFVKGRVEDQLLVAQLFNQHRFDYVYHLAAYAAEGLSHFIKTFNYTNNLIGSINLINAAVNTGSVKCFVFTSSIAVYGRNQLPMKENFVPQPEDPYGIAKYAVELDLKEAHEMFGLNYIIFRPHNVYGERQNLSDPYRNVIGIFMKQIRHGKPLTIFGDGKQKRAFSYISDVAPIIARSVQRKNSYNQVFNVGADHPYSVLALAKEVSRCMAAKPEITHLAARNEVVNAYSTHAKARRHFGDLMANVSLREGLSRMSAWARTAKIYPTKPFDGIEVFKNLPPAWASMTKSRNQ